MIYFEELIQGMWAQWAPPPKQSVSEWAEENFRLSPEYSAVTGKLKLYKFQREPVDEIGNPYVKELIVMSATQMLKTLVDQVAIAHGVVCDPGPILMAQPTATDAETFSKERLTPMIRDMECLREVFAADKKTSSANTIIHKVFRGGSLSLIGAQTAGEFARRSIRLFIGDERDKWKKNVGKEGDGWALGVKRTSTFRSRAKLIQTCSPTVDGDSAIAKAYERSDQRKFHVPCPSCGHLQILTWDRARWAGDDASTARYHCAACDYGWNDVERWNACEAEAAKWIAEKPFEGVAGFWISEIYSPWKLLSAIVQDFLDKKEDPATLQTFVNTSLAETWKEKGDAPPHETIIARAESYSLVQVPRGVLFLTAGIDVQQDRWEIAVWGWGRNRHRWLVDYVVIEGSPAKAEDWAPLTEAVNVSYQTEGGVDLPIRRAAIDSGYEAEMVYRWARQQGPGRVLVVKGNDRGVSLLGVPTAVDISTKGKHQKWGVKVWPINVSLAKMELYGQIKIERADGASDYPAGWIHIPSAGWVRPTLEEFARQLVAEQYVTRIVKGYKRGEWVNARPGGRNEALDTANYARAAAEHCGISRMQELLWQSLEKQMGLTESAPPEPEQAPAPVIQKQQTAAPIRRTFAPRIIGRFS